MRILENKALVIKGKKQMEIENRPIGEPGPEDVVIKIEMCGICGTDLHFWAHNAVGFWTLKTPCVLGHEASGRVTNIGSAVRNLKIGDRVTIEPSSYCGKCLDCTAGKNNLCHMNTVELLEPEGFFQNYVVYPSYLCHRLPDNVTLEEGAVVEPLACALRGVLRAKVKAGEDVLILGCGPIGMLAGQACKSYGAHKIVITDINQERLDIALETRSADACYQVTREKDLAAQRHDLISLMGRQPDVTLDCTGLESCLRLAIDVTRRGGRVGLVGLSGGNVSVPLTIASMKEIDLISSAKYDTTDFRLALKMLENKVINVRSIISHTIRLENFNEAFGMLESGKGTKILIQC